MAFRYTVFLILQLSFVIQLFSQVETLGDMERALVNVEDKIERCSLYYILGEQYFENWELDKSIQSYEAALQLAIENEDVIMQSQCFSSLGANYLDKSLPDTAFLFTHKALKVLNVLTEDSSLIIQELKSGIHFQFGVICGRGYEDAKKGLHHFILALEYAEKSKNFDKIIDAYLGLTFFHSSFDHAQCIRFGEKALQLAKGGNVEFKVADIQRIMGNSYLLHVKDKDELKKGKHYIINSINYYKQTNRNFELADSWSALGDYFTLRGALDSALHYTQLSYSLFQELDTPTSTITTAVTLAEIFYKKGDYQYGIQIVEKYNETPQVKRNLSLAKSLYTILAKCYEKTGQYKKGYETLMLRKMAADSLFEKKWDIESNKLRIKFNADWLEKEQGILVEKNEALAEKNEILHTRSYLYFWMVSLLLLLLVGSIWFFRKVKLKNSLIQNQKDELEILNENKDRFFGIIAHDLRSPVISLEGLAQKFNYLLQKNRTDDIRRLGSVVESTLGDVYKLIDNLLNWALIEQKRFPHRPEVIEVVEIVEDVIRNYKGIADVKGIQLSSVISTDFHIYADKYAITAVIRNITDNAIKFTHPNGKVSLSAKQERKQVVICVEDTGVGIPREMLKKLFILEGQGGNDGTEGEKGSGLGLVLCKELIEKNKGDIKVESIEGEGTTFSISLPIQK